MSPPDQSLSILSRYLSASQGNQVAPLLPPPVASNRVYTNPLATLPPLARPHPSFSQVNSALPPVNAPVSADESRRAPGAQGIICGGCLARRNTFRCFRASRRRSGLAISLVFIWRLRAYGRGATEHDRVYSKEARSAPALRFLCAAVLCVSGLVIFTDGSASSVFGHHSQPGTATSAPSTTLSRTRSHLANHSRRRLLLYAHGSTPGAAPAFLECVRPGEVALVAFDPATQTVRQVIASAKAAAAGLRLQSVGVLAPVETVNGIGAVAEANHRLTSTTYPPMRLRLRWE